MYRLSFLAILVQSFSLLCQNNISEVEQKTFFSPKKIDSTYNYYLIESWEALNLSTGNKNFSKGSSVNELSDSVIEFNLNLLDKTTPLDIRCTKEVKNIISYYLKSNPDLLKRLKSRSRFYFPLFESALDRYNLPLELKYIPVIESALNPRAKSKAGATGLWQFMYATGKMQGLEIGSYVDQRMDPRLSTDAACRYLKKLYDIFQNWELALAAYNAGPGNITRAIRNSEGGKNYWEIRPYLSRETSNYIPSLISAIYVLQVVDHILINKSPSLLYLETDTVYAKNGIYFQDITYLLSIDSSTISKLNPQYKHQYVPPPKNNISYSLVIPKIKINEFYLLSDSLYSMAALRLEKTPLPPPLRAASGKTYIVRSGDTLSEIAQKNKIKIQDLRRWNGIRGSKIRIGQKLKI
ncbi:MAG: lytic transglycosylase [Cryomorphaceae bacterium]|jgi:membrane-bound lytic murein transglycosylase D|nr:lytic transglycosylase [Cryomorphaceae bacterium]